MADVDIADVTTGTADSGDDLLGVGRPANVARLFSISSIIALAQTFASPLLGPAGSAGNPAFSFTGDPNTGISNSAADTIAFSAGGTYRATLNTTSISTTIPVYADVFPGIAVGIASNRGIGSEAADQVFMLASTPKWVLSNNSGTPFNAIGASTMFGWVASGEPSTTAPDTALIRQAAGIIALTNGSTGGAAMLYREQSTPTGVTDAAIVYADVSGAKTRLMCIFQTGAAQQVAIEP